MENLKKRIENFDAQLVKKSANQLIDQRNLLIEQYNRQLKKLEDEITAFNEWVKQANQNLDAEKAKLEKINTSLELEIKNCNEWFRLNKEEQNVPGIAIPEKECGYRWPFGPQFLESIRCLF